MSDTTTLTLTEFLLARIAEDEASAPSHTGVAAQGDIEINGRLHAMMGTVRFDPARVLAECEAKRRIVAEHPLMRVHPDSDLRACETCLDYNEWGDDMMKAYPCPTLCALVLPYADHPDYREEWRV